MIDVKHPWFGSSIVPCIVGVALGRPRHIMGVAHVGAHLSPGDTRRRFPFEGGTRLAAAGMGEGIESSVL